MRQPSILAALVAHAEADPARPGVIWADTTYSYAEVTAAAASWGTLYSRMGVGRGERVGLFLASGPAFLGAYLGAHAAGAAVVLINTQYRQVELAHLLTDSEPRLIVTDHEGEVQLSGLRHNLPLTITVANDSLTPPEPEAGLLQLPQPNDLAILAYTSGTTGRAKGAMLTHGCLAANSAAVCEAWHWTSADRLLLVLPLFHIHGLGVGVHGTLTAGASLVLRPRFEPAETLATLAEGACSMFFGVPTMYTRLIQAAERQMELIAPLPVRLCVSGSAPLTPQTFAAFEERFGQRILERYGMTETGMNLTNPYLGERRPGTVGQPFPGQQARVVDQEQHELSEPGAVGEIQVRGPHVFAGYWRNPEASAAVLASDGWFSTGDLGWRSADGYYTLTGRARELIITGGYNVYPREVEEVLLDHPAVHECAVFGLPDPDLGERVVAAIVCTPGQQPTPDELIAFCRERLAAYKQPRSIFVVASLPRNAMGKVQKHELQAQYR